MTFSPQIPHWGDANNKFSEKLYKYHSWLLETGIKNGLISNKDPQFVWDEFIIHSLYFGKIINELDQTFDSIYDLGTGGGIPGIPVAITNPKNQFILVDISESRVFELQRLKNILNLNNVEIIQKDARSVISNNNLYISRCYISSKDALESIKKNKNTVYIVSSNGEKIEHNKNMFHVKQENFTINSTDIRHIDVITVR